MAKHTTPQPQFIQYKVGGALALLLEQDGILIEFPIYGQAHRTILDNFTIEGLKEESTYYIIKLVKK